VTSNNISDRAKLTGEPLEPPAGSDRTLWFNPAAFAPADVGTYGDVPKGFLRGPSFHSWNMGLFKNVRFNSDVNVQLRVEFFNIFNQVNFDTPANSGDNASVSGAAFGTITRTDRGFGDPRIIQFGLKFVF
jgi:hypothetical protein